MTYYISYAHGVISNNPDQCQGCDLNPIMEPIAADKALSLLSIRNEGKYEWFNASTLDRP